MIITSAQNQRIKEVAKLRTAKERRATGLFSVEGVREVQRALSCGFELTELYFCQDVLDDGTREAFKSDCEQIEVSSSVFKKIAVREESGGVVGVFKSRTTKLSDLELSNSPLLVVAEGVEKPGNLGAILRSADAGGVDALVVIDEKVDLFNPNVIRSSLGTAFSVKVACCNCEEFREFCSDREISIYGAALSDKAVSYTSVNLKKPTALLLGSEAFGLSSYWLENSDSLVHIPMKGIADSLNVSAAGAVLVYEALRQREA